jgi:uncharacterized protein YbjT (DUF2867 family)
MSVLKNVVIIGGSGNVGREILSALIERKADFGNIVALQREGVAVPEVIRGFEKQGVRVIEANLQDKSALIAAFKGNFLSLLKLTRLFRCRCSNFNCQ